MIISNRRDPIYLYMMLCWCCVPNFLTLWVRMSNFLGDVTRRRTLLNVAGENRLAMIGPKSQLKANWYNVVKRYRMYQNSVPTLLFVKGLLHYVTFGDKTFASRLTPWGHYTARSKKIQTLVYTWSKPTPRFSHVCASLLKICTFFIFWQSDFVAIW